jgi:hypothetical protein
VKRGVKNGVKRGVKNGVNGVNNGVNGAGAATSRLQLPATQAAIKQQPQNALTISRRRAGR